MAKVAFSGKRLWVCIFFTQHFFHPNVVAKGLVAKVAANVLVAKVVAKVWQTF